MTERARRTISARSGPAGAPMSIRLPTPRASTSGCRLRREPRSLQPDVDALGVGKRIDIGAPAGPDLAEIVRLARSVIQIAWIRHGSARAVNRRRVQAVGPRIERVRGLLHLVVTALRVRGVDHAYAAVDLIEARADLEEAQVDPQRGEVEARHVAADRLHALRGPGVQGGRVTAALDAGADGVWVPALDTGLMLARRERAARRHVEVRRDARREGL